MKNKVEWITCLCGEIIAGCADGHQDEEWNTQKDTYLRKGYTAEVSDNDTKQFGSCRCKHIIGWVKENHPSKYETLGLEINE